MPHEIMRRLDHLWVVLEAHVLVYDDDHDELLLCQMLGTSSIANMLSANYVPSMASGIASSPRSKHGRCMASFHSVRTANVAPARLRSRRRRCGRSPAIVGPGHEHGGGEL